MTGHERDLVTSEGVDEGSAASGTEAASDDKASDVFGVRAAGAPDNGEQQAAPELLVTGQEEPRQPGQQQQVGER
jgi:hypothetical protein